MPVKTIFKCQFGSHLYGTDTPTSDKDFKSVYIPDGKDIIMQLAKKSDHNHTKKGSDTKNTSEDVDHEKFSVAEFFKLLCQGQTAQIEMLFAPTCMILSYTEEWNEIVKNRHEFLHKGTTAFVGYTRQQASKYGVKGFRVAALREAISFLKAFSDPHMRLYEIGGDLFNRWIAEIGNDQIAITYLTDKKGVEEAYLQVCDRKVPLNATVKYALDVFERLFKIYGERALKAEKNEGIDWKALSHAVRVANQSIELLKTGQLILPRPDRELLLKIKLGQLPYREVEEIIEQGLLKVESAQVESLLPDKPNVEYANELIEKFHLEAVKKTYG